MDYKVKIMLILISIFIIYLIAVSYKQKEDFLLPNCTVGASPVTLETAITLPFVYIKHAVTGTYLVEDPGGTTPVNQTITDYKSAPRYKIKKIATKLWQKKSF